MGNICNFPYLHASPKLIAFFQTLHTLDQSIYFFFSKNFGGYNERTVQCMNASQSSDMPIVNCKSQVIKSRAKIWINQIQKEFPNKLILVSAMADTMKVPTVGEFSYKYNMWVSGKYPNHCIKASHYVQEKLMTNEKTTEIKVGIISLQDAVAGISLFKILSNHPQSTNESCDSYNEDIMNAVSGLVNVHCISIAFDGSVMETNSIQTNLVVFMKGNSNTVVMTDCNHAAKNIRSQIVLGSSIITRGQVCF